MGCGASADTSGEAFRIPQAMLDTGLANTKYTEEEICNWYEAFMYEHSDGQMGEEGFIKLYQRLYPNGNAKDFSNVLFNAYDKDGSGTIDFNEFIETMNLAGNGTTYDKLRWAFRLYDLDKSGYISRIEAVTIIKAIYKMQGISADGNEFFLPADETVDALWGQLEKDEDGKLSEQEFVLGAQSNKKITQMLQSM